MQKHEKTMKLISDSLTCKILQVLVHYKSEMSLAKSYENIGHFDFWQFLPHCKMFFVVISAKRNYWWSIWGASRLYLCHENFTPVLFPKRAPQWEVFANWNTEMSSNLYTPISCLESCKHTILLEIFENACHMCPSLRRVHVILKISSAKHHHKVSSEGAESKIMFALTQFSRVSASNIGDNQNTILHEWLLQIFTATCQCNDRYLTTTIVSFLHSTEASFGGQKVLQMLQAINGSKLLYYLQMT